METVDKVRLKLNSQQTSWDDLWKDGLTPWDLGKATPLLISELEKERNKMVVKEPPRLRSLVPGCGGGYDLLTLQSHHTAILQNDSSESVIVGLDMSATALKSAERTVKGANDGSTRLELRCGDFFDDPSKWDAVYSSKDRGESVSQFDFIFDYTFFCALPPTLRPNWGEQMAKLLDPDTGRLLTLMFPILPEAEMQGPPYPVSIKDYAQVLEPHGITMDGDPFESPLSVPSRAGKEMVCYWTFDKLKSGQSSL